MIKVSNKVVKKQHNFWNNILFHPTDAVEDSWGKRILDKVAEDKCAKTVRVYTMFEDIVYIDMDGQLQYDFRTSDLRLDYLVEKGFDLLLAYAAMPDCIAKSVDEKTSVSFNKTRYKGKLFNTSPPSDYALWEEVCYQYTKHIVERYGIETVSKWKMQCFNEPDIICFFMSSLPRTETAQRLKEYCKLYEAFEKGIRRVSDEIKIGGPSLALYYEEFLRPWLGYVKDNNLKLDFISFHNYGHLAFYEAKKLGVNALNVDNHFQKHEKVMNVINECGFEDTPIIIDEWGAAGGGFKNKTQVPELIFRETEVFAAYFAKLIYRHINSDYNIDTLMICLSGQHEMTEEFTGFRGFFTLNNIAKPIYNAHALAAKLKENLLEYRVENENLYVIPTKDDEDNFAVLLSYSSDNFEEDLPVIEETVKFDCEMQNKEVTVWCIDKENTNPYRLYERMGIEIPTAEEISILKEEGKLKPIAQLKGENEIKIKLSSNATYLITVSEE